MLLKEALSVMSKSSPYAVTTERSEHGKNELDLIKEYLYIQMPIAMDVEGKISSFSANKPEVLFLCGSSGDGKSELLTACKKKFGTRAEFHLDATHSFDPRENAIQTLDKVFDEYLSQSKPLVVGINTGMLGNYAEEGSNEFFKSTIKNYLETGSDRNGMYFVDFERYPKFAIDEESYTSVFAEKLLNKLTAKEDNLIRQIFDKDKLECTDPDSRRLQANYELLSLPAVQRTVIDLLFKARLMKDQFVTARSLLDFLFMLIAGPGYLFDNLFSGGDNELANKIVEFDPAHLRTNNIDRFILANDLGLPDSDFEEFKTHLSELGVGGLKNSYSYLRLFYILSDENFANNFHNRFAQDYSQSLIEEYISIYKNHRDYDNSDECRSVIREFCNNTLRAAIRKYNNRNAPNLKNNYYLISERNGYQLVAKLEIKPDLKNIAKQPPTQVSYFTACITVGGDSLTLPVNINLLQLMRKIVDGYRPNKHDKNTVVLLDELVEKISKIASKENTLHIINGSQHITVTDDEDDKYEVSGLNND
ncbi:DNA phosphorothioation-dependent restriction protein DptF [Enterovibrio norvegicus]|uniref:DNA phosphorothioation-dependent restriction protein DptF n=1 Tax=Enterovibrio norvegicus TaxID=188144 RepID=UPI0003143D36|nr:DNA phosphorothioation-dependent restriction protein DptF [Enterovibrio norvegicus]OEF49182.1 DNA phosphorothioation-dependent restriction protein DptF [Enterovibrio norvegicus]